VTEGLTHLDTPNLELLGSGLGMRARGANGLRERRALNGMCARWRIGMVHRGGWEIFSWGTWRGKLGAGRGMEILSRITRSGFITSSA